MAVIETFVAAKGGTPIVENQTRLIFLAKDKDGVAPRIVGDFNGWAVTPQGYDAAIGKTTRFEGSCWSYLESTSYTNARLEYGFLYEKEYTADPLNPRTVQAFAGPRSEVRMPFFVAQPEVDELGSAPTGQLVAESFESRSLGGKRRVWFYLPPGYPSTSLRAGAGSSDTLYPVVYVLDGANYVEKMDVPKVLDHLIANKTIPPVIAVFSEPADRQEEYSRNPKWRAFIATELVPAVDKRFRTFPDPGSPGHSRQLAGRLWRDRSRRRRAIGVRAVRRHRPAGPDRDRRLEPAERPGRGRVDQVLRAWAASTTR